MTSNLILKYADSLIQMEKEAVENVKNAENVSQEKRKEREDANSRLTRIKETMDENYREFWNMAWTIIKMLFKRPGNPAEIERALMPINGYKDALKSVPAAEKDCETAQKNYQASKLELSKAVKLQKMLKEIQNL